MEYDVSDINSSVQYNIQYRSPLNVLELRSIINFFLKKKKMDLRTSEQQISKVLINGVKRVLHHTGGVFASTDDTNYLNIV